MPRLRRPQGEDGDWIFGVLVWAILVMCLLQLPSPSPTPSPKASPAHDLPVNREQDYTTDEILMLKEEDMETEMRDAVREAESESHTSSHSIVSLKEDTLLAENNDPVHESTSNSSISSASEAAVPPLLEMAERGELKSQMAEQHVEPERSPHQRAKGDTGTHAGGDNMKTVLGLIIAGMAVRTVSRWVNTPIPFSFPLGPLPDARRLQHTSAHVQHTSGQLQHTGELLQHTGVHLDARSAHGVTSFTSLDVAAEWQPGHVDEKTVSLATGNGHGQLSELSLQFRNVSVDACYEEKYSILIHNRLNVVVELLSGDGISLAKYGEWKHAMVCASKVGQTDTVRQMLLGRVMEIFESQAALEAADSFPVDKHDRAVRREWASTTECPAGTCRGPSESLVPILQSEVDVNEKSCSRHLSRCCAAPGRGVGRLLELIRKDEDIDIQVEDENSAVL